MGDCLQCRRSPSRACARTALCDCCSAPLPSLASSSRGEPSCLLSQHLCPSHLCPPHPAHLDPPTPSQPCLQTWRPRCSRRQPVGMATVAATAAATPAAAALAMAAAAVLASPLLLALLSWRGPRPAWEAPLVGAPTMAPAAAVAAGGRTSRGLRSGHRMGGSRSSIGGLSPHRHRSRRGAVIGRRPVMRMRRVSSGSKRQ